MEIEGIITEVTQKYVDIQTTNNSLKKGNKIRIYNLENKTEESEISPFKKGRFNLTLSECPDYIKADGISFYGEGTIYHIEHNNGNIIKKSAYKVRSLLSSRINELFEESKITASFINAVILGETSGLSDDVYSDYGRLGITHIVAVSGLHFTIIIMSIYKILCFFHIKQKPRCIICIPLAIFYCFITGSSPSSVRALIMLIILLLGKIFLYSSDTLTSLSVAAFIIILLNPYSIFSTSFILSFLATFAITIAPSVMPNAENQSKNYSLNKLKNTIQSIFITLIISMFIAPTLYNRFQTFSLITPLANLILSLIFAPIMYISLSAVALSYFNIPEFFIRIVTEIIEFFHKVIDKVSSFKGISIAPQRYLVIIIYVTVFTCAISALFLRKKTREKTIKLTVYFFALSVIIAVMINQYIHSNYEQIYFSNNGNSALSIKDGNILYIAENEKALNPNFLISNNVLDIDALIIKNIKAKENAENKIQSFLQQCKTEKIYSNLDLKSIDGIDVHSIDSFESDYINITNKYGINVVFNNSKKLLWLGDGSRGLNKYQNIDTLILSESFFNNKANISFIPSSITNFYIPYSVDDSYIKRFLEINYPYSKINYIKDFKHKIKN